MHVYRWVLHVRPMGYFLTIFEWEYGAGKGVLEGDNACGGKVDIGR